MNRRQNKVFFLSFLSFYFTCLLFPSEPPLLLSYRRGRDGHVGSDYGVAMSGGAYNGSCGDEM